LKRASKNPKNVFFTKKELCQEMKNLFLTRKQNCQKTFFDKIKKGLKEVENKGFIFNDDI